MKSERITKQNETERYGSSLTPINQQQLDTDRLPSSVYNK